MIESTEFSPHKIRIEVPRRLTMLRPSPFPETRLSLLGTLRGADPANASWRRFFELYAPSVFRVARRMGLNMADADDVVQQVMVAVSAHIGRFEPDEHRGRFRHWIRAITANKVSDCFRRRAGQPATLAGDDAKLPAVIDVEQLWAEEWYLQDLQECLRKIEREVAPKRYEAFQLYALGGVSAEETARRCDMTRAHVYVIRNQIIRRLRELFDELHADETES